MKRNTDIIIGILIVLLIVALIVLYILYREHPLCNVSSEKNIVIPASRFDNNNTIKCKNKVYTLRKKANNNDPGHNIYYVDPPPNNKNAYDCDGKADVGIKNIAMNCLPVRDES